MSYNKFQLPINANCQYYENGQLITLNPHQYDRLQTLCAMISANHHTKFVYRADDRLEQTYQISDKNSTALADIVFMIGAKGNAFTNIKYDNTINSNHAKQLFLTIRDVMVNRSNNRQAVRKRMPRFRFLNSNFYQFFTNQQNISKLSRIFLSKSAFMVNDYYEMFLHGVSRNGLNNKYSEMLSTTLERRVARRFTHGNGIVYVGWVHDSGYITFGDMNKRNDKIKALDLPTYTSVFPKQKEICLKYGLPPHNIIGYFRDNEHFVVNHHFLLNKKNSMTPLENILKHGFYIDQSNFLQYLGRTRYVRGYDVINNRYIH